jgi:transposase
MKKKELLTVKELAAELRMSVKTIQRAYRKEEIPMNCSFFSLAVAPGYIRSHLDTSD